MRRIVVFAILFASVGLAAWGAGRWASAAYEKMLETRIRQGLATLGIGWAEADVDGLRVTIAGQAPNQEAKTLALGAVAAIARGAHLIDDLDVRVSPLPAKPPVSFDLLRDLEGITITGDLAGEAMRDGLTSALEGITEVYDLATLEARAPGESWGSEVEIAAAAARSLTTAHISVEEGLVTVRGVAPDDDMRKSVEAELEALAGERVDLVLELRTPAQLITPFRFAASRSFGGAETVIEACAARNTSELQEIEKLLDRIAPAPGDGRCMAGIGGPEGDWPAAIEAGLEALGALPSGRLEIDGDRVTLTGLPPTDEVDFGVAMGRLAGDLPEGFALTGRVELPPAEAEAESRLAYWLRIRRSEDAEGDEVLVVFGIAPSIELRDAQLTYAASIFGDDAVQSRIELATVAPPKGWNQAVLASLTLLALMDEGEVELAGNTVTLTGTVSDPEDAREIQRLAGDHIPGFEVSTRIQVDLPTALEALELPAAPCAARLAELMGDQPILFETGARRIAEGSLATIDLVAAQLARCPAVSFEIGGHTDAQGAADMNERLSKARAEAVLDALVEGGIPRDRLAAKGYGETQPIADNGTFEGRARNRRIEFRPIAPSVDTQAQAGGETEGD